MDSLTQIVLGAAIGEAVAGKRIGNKAMLWGAVAGTIPDLDTLLNPWLGMVEQLIFHRSVTHSFLFAALTSPLLGYLLWHFYKKDQTSYFQWTLLFFLAFTTHAILDSFTTWGTQLFWPFSDKGIAFYNISVIDPFYTVPFLACVIVAAFYNKRSQTRANLNFAGLIISSTYVIFTFYAKSQSNQAFEENLEHQGISYESYISKPTPFNAILWSVTAKTKEGFYTGFYSLLDEDHVVNFEFEPKQHNLLAAYRGNKELEKLLKITKGYYSVTNSEKGVYIIDLRFGKFDGWQKGEGRYVFVYHVVPLGATFAFEEINYRPKPDAAYWKSFLNRILGKR